MRTWLVGTLVTAFAASLPAQGYEWDHPDGIGVRYLLYKKMRKRDVRPEYEGPDIRVAYTPTDENDWVRVRGYPMDWGVMVYEFREDGAEESATSFEEFLRSKDPYLERHRREILVTGDEDAADGIRLWEYRDQFVPFVYVLDKSAPGGRVWAENDVWDVRFPVPKGMVSFDADDDARRTWGPNLRSRLRAHTNDWIRLKGHERKQAWFVFVYEFPDDAEPQDRDLWARHFEELVTQKQDQRRRHFTARDEETKARGLPFRHWEWYDDHRTAAGNPRVVHHVAAAYDLPGREIALDFWYPNEDEKPDRKMHKLAAAVVSGLVPAPDAAPDESVGTSNHYIASSRVVDGKEVAIIVSIPVENGQNPDPVLQGRARTIVKSLQPDR